MKIGDRDVDVDVPQAENRSAAAVGEALAQERFGCTVAKLHAALVRLSFRTFKSDMEAIDALYQEVKS